MLRRARKAELRGAELRRTKLQMMGENIDNGKLWRAKLRRSN